MNIYLHKHHIVPKHAGGTDDSSNLVELTVEDHAIAHKVLYGLYGRWQDKLAWQGLSGMISKQDIAASNKGKVWYNNGSESILTFEGEQPKGFIRGRKITEEHKEKLSSEETRAKISAAKKGRTFSAETRAKLSAASKGRTFSAETRAKLSDSLKGRLPPKTECCGKMYDPGNLKRHIKAKHP